MVNAQLVVDILCNTDSLLTKDIKPGDIVLVWDKGMYSACIFGLGYYKAFEKGNTLCHRVEIPYWDGRISGWTNVAKVPEDLISRCKEVLGDKND